MKFLITNFSLFVLLLLIIANYNQSIEIDNNPDKFIIENQHYKSLGKYKRDTSLSNDFYKKIPYGKKKEICTRTIKEIFGGNYDFTQFLGLNEFGNNNLWSTYFNSTIEDKTNQDMKNITLKFTAFSNGDSPLCETYEWNLK